MNSILWPVWWTIERDLLDDDERGVIPVTEEVCMMKLSTTIILFGNGIIRPVFLAWLLDELLGRDRVVAMTQEPAKPLVKPYSVQTETAAPALSKAAPSKFGRTAKLPTVPSPPLDCMQQPDAQTAYLQAVDETASSLSSGYIPLARILEAAAAAAKAKASAAKAIPPPKESAASAAKANPPPKASAASATTANPPSKASAASTVKANPPPKAFKASAASSAKAATPVAAQGFD